MSHTNFLDDFVDLEPFAADAGRHPRTVRRWLNQPDGLPFTRIGNRILIHVPTAREWLMKRMRKPAPRRRGQAAAATAEIGAA
jgi:hypothetical protein